jgi:hypothetical protein
VTIDATPLVRGILAALFVYWLLGAVVASYRRARAHVLRRRRPWDGATWEPPAPRRTEDEDDPVEHPGHDPRIIVEGPYPTGRIRPILRSSKQ